MNKHIKWMSIREKRIKEVDWGKSIYTKNKNVQNIKRRRSFAYESEEALQKCKIWGGLGFCTSFGTNFDAELGGYKDFFTEHLEK